MTWCFVWPEDVEETVTIIWESSASMAKTHRLRLPNLRE